MEENNYPTGGEMGSVATMFNQMTAGRDPFLQRARDCSALTIPSLIPPNGWNYSDRLRTPFQSSGSRGVNNLASKLGLALLPPNSPFFRLQISESSLQLIEARGGETAKSEVTESLAAIEREVQAEVEASALRVPFFEALDHLIVGGNALVYLDDEDGMRVYHLDNYVVKRDPMGNVLRIIVCEKIAKSALPENLKAYVHNQTAQHGEAYGPTETTVAVYTHVYREDGKMKVEQEVCGGIIPESLGWYKLEECPWMPLRFKSISGEDYGRGHVEAYLGDLQSLEGLAQAIVEGSAAAARVLFLNSSTGTTSSKKIAEAPNGAVITGNKEDVTVLALEKYADFRVAAETANSLKEQLAFAFLLNTAIQRNGERVTAEEIRYMAGELEAALGGVYAILSVEFQLPLVRRLLAQMTKKKLIPKLPRGVRPVVVTGIEALGRGHDLSRLRLVGQVLTETLGPNGPSSVLNTTEFARRVVTAGGVEMRDLVKTDQEILAAQQQAQAQHAVEHLGPEALKQMGNQAAAQRAAQQGQTPQ